MNKILTICYKIDILFINIPLALTIREDEYLSGNRSVVQMIKEINCKKVNGTVRIPASKSYGHRALIALSLSKGKGVLDNFDMSLDIMATLKCLEDLGVDFIFSDRSLSIDATRFGQFRDRTMKPEESGSTLRFFIPITLLFDEVFEFRCKTGLLKRPLTVYEELFKDLDIVLYRDSLESLVVKGRLSSGEFTMRGDVSSQFISGMLLVLPMLEGDSVLKVTGELESEGYVNMTLKVMEDFGIEVTRDGNTFYVRGNQSYLARDYKIEGDYSQGAFMLAAGVLGGDVTVTGLEKNTAQGDADIVRIIRDMGGVIEVTEEGLRARRSDLKAIDIDISQTPDLTPILGVLLSLSRGTGRLLNGKRLRYKESDRIKTTVAMINSLGGDAREDGEDIVIEGKEMLKGGRSFAFNDHRIVMASSVAALRSLDKVYIDGYEAVNKSYPEFFNDFEHMLCNR